MLIFKFLVAILVVCVCGQVGVRKAKRYENREYILREALFLFKGIENEIKYGLTPLPNAIESVRVTMKTSLKDVLGAVGYELLQYNVQDTNIVNEIAKLDELTPYDKQIISSGIIELGKTDVEGQITKINMICASLKNQLNDSIEEKKKNSKMYKTVGFAMGLMIAVVFI